MLTPRLELKPWAGSSFNILLKVFRVLHLLLYNLNFKSHRRTYILLQQLYLGEPHGERMRYRWWLVAKAPRTLWLSVFHAVDADFDVYVLLLECVWLFLPLVNQGSRAKLGTARVTSLCDVFIALTKQPSLGLSFSLWQTALPLDGLQLEESAAVPWERKVS